MSAPSIHLPAVKQTILAAYCNTFYGKVEADQFVDTLSRLFRLKAKMLGNLAAYVDREIARGKPLDKTLNNISFFASILVEHIDRSGNQPIDKS